MSSFFISNHFKRGSFSWSPMFLSFFWLFSLNLVLFILKKSGLNDSFHLREYFLSGKLKIHICGSTLLECTGTCTCTSKIHTNAHA